MRTPKLFILPLVLCFSPMLQAQELEVRSLRYARSSSGTVFVARLALRQPNPLMHRLVARADRGTATELYLSDPSKGRAELCGLLPQGGKARLVLYRVSVRDLSAAPTKLGSLELTAPPRPGADAPLVARWREHRARTMALRQLLMGQSSFEQYVGLMAAHRIGSDRFRRRTRQVDLFAMTTGALAIQEALQLEALQLTGDSAEVPRIPLGQLKGPQIKSHPYARMIGDRSPTLSQITRLIPADQYYFHAHSIQKLLALLDFSEDWGDQLLIGARVSARDAQLKRRYLDQLMLQTSKLTRLLGDKVIGELAVTGSDPFVREGTDFSLLLQVKDRGTLFSRLNQYRKQALAAHPDARVRRLTHQRVQIDGVETAAREISSYRAELGPYLILSNSLVALKRIIDTYRNPRGSLVRSLDFRYMRVLYPGTRKAEDAFLFLSDAWVRRMVGPSHKLAGVRRMRCAGQMRMLQNARMLYRAERLAEPKIGQLLADGYLPAASGRCPEGKPYTIVNGVVHCARHNRLGFLTPLAELPVTHVTPAESQAYQQFVQEYQDYWREFFDPIGIQIRYRNKRLRLETRILPLVDSTIYTGLKAFVGKARKLSVQSPTDCVGMLRLALDRKGLIELSKSLHKQGREFGLTQRLALEQAFRPQLAVRVHDIDPLFTWDNEIFGELYRDSTRGGGMSQELLIASLMLAINFPVSAEIPVADAKAARHLMDQLEQALALTARKLAAKNRTGRAQFNEKLQVYRYPYKGVQIGVVQMQVTIKIRIFYCLLPDRLILATKRPLIQRLISGPPRKVEAGPRTLKGHLLCDILPGRFDKLRPTVSLHWQEQLQLACFNNFSPLGLFHRYGKSPREGVMARIEQVLGYRPFCPAGGRYQYQSTADRVVCSTHGTPLSPRLLAQLSSTLPAVKRMESIQRVRIQLEFTPEGLRTVLTIQEK